MKAMILAAGRGKRLRPLTDHTPKPLVEVRGKPLIVHHIERLAEAGFRQLVINHAWLGEKIEAALGDGKQWGVEIVFTPEPPGGYETAGGIIQALPILTENTDQFLVVNGDVWTDYSFEQLRTIKLNPERLAHLILVPKPAQQAEGDFALLADSKVAPQGDLTFSGISVLHRALLANEPLARLKLAPFLRQAMAEKKVTGELFTGVWEDVGTLERLQKLLSCRCPYGV